MRPLLILFLFLFSIPVYAKHVNVLRNLPLSPAEGGLHETRISFAEMPNGESGASSAGDGCILQVRSKSNFFLAGRYKVGLEEEIKPGPVDDRWRKQYTVWVSGLDLRVSCRSLQPIDDEYIWRVMGGYVRMEI